MNEAWEAKVKSTEARTANIGLAKYWLDGRTIGSLAKPGSGPGWISDLQLQIITSRRYFHSAAVMDRRNANITNSPSR